MLCILLSILEEWEEKTWNQNTNKWAKASSRKALGLPLLTPNTSKGEQLHR